MTHSRPPVRTHLLLDLSHLLPALSHLLPALSRPLLALACLLLAPCARANEVADFWPAHADRDPWRVSWLPAAVPAVPAAPAVHLVLPAPVALVQDDPAPRHAVAVEHSDAYQTRAKIHRYASFATLPLFAAELWLGDSLYNDSTNPDPRRGAHAAIGAGIVGLFAVNTVTGAWNLFGEGRDEQNGRTVRLVHGLLMMVADAGFVATSMSGPNSSGRRGALTFETDKVTHRNLALGSIGVATASYLLMIFGGR